LELVREASVAAHPEGVAAGAWLGMRMRHMSQGQPLAGKAVYEAGVLGDFKAAVGRWKPLERISKRNWG
jgi:hypothetical protein